MQSGRLGLALGIGELRNRDRGKDADDHDDDQQFDQREAVPGPGGPRVDACSMIRCLVMGTLQSNAETVIG